VWRVPLKFSTKFNLGAGVSVVLDSGTYLIGIYCDHANFDDVRVEVQIDGGWQELKDIASGGTFKPRNQAVFGMSHWAVPCDGVNIRIRNQNAAQTNNIIYAYVDV